MFIVHCVIGVFVTYGPLILLFSVRVFCICYVYCDIRSSVFCTCVINNTNKQTTANHCHRSYKAT